MRTHGNTMVWLGAGMATGLALVALAVLTGPGPFEFTTDYRVAGFSGTHVSGGQIGAYIAMALVFFSSFSSAHVISPLSR